MKILNVKIDGKIKDDIRKYSQESGIKLYKVIECALLHYLDKVKRIKPRHIMAAVLGYVCRDTHARSRRI